MFQRGETSCWGLQSTWPTPFAASGCEGMTMRKAKVWDWQIIELLLAQDFLKTGECGTVR